MLFAQNSSALALFLQFLSSDFQEGQHSTLCAAQLANLALNIKSFGKLELWTQRCPSRRYCRHVLPFRRHCDDSSMSSGAPRDNNGLETSTLSRRVLRTCDHISQHRCHWCIIGNFLQQKPTVARSASRTRNHDKSSPIFHA